MFDHTEKLEWRKYIKDVLLQHLGLPEILENGVGQRSPA